MPLTPVPVSVLRRRAAGAAMLAALAAAGSPAHAQAIVYRCPGPPVEYTDAVSPQEAKARNCRSIENTPITVLQTRKPTAAPATSGGGARSAEGRVDASDQRGRDLEARRILEAELRREEDKLAALQKEFNGGEPERRGDERNYQKYAERIAAMKADIERKQSDVEAIRRELAKLPAL